EATQTLVNGIVGEIDFGELVRGDVDELAAEETDDEDSEEDDSDSGSSDEEDDEDDGSDDEDESGSSSTYSSEGLPTPRLSTPSRPIHQSTVPVHARNQSVPVIIPLPPTTTSDLRSKPLPPSPPRTDHDGSPVRRPTQMSNKTHRENLSVPS